MDNGLLIGAYDIFRATKDWDKAVGCAVNIFNEDPKYGYGYLEEIRSLVQGDKSIKTSDKMELLRRTYVAGGREKFDDFMLAIEWDRDTDKKFWLPRREKLMVVCDALQRLEDNELDELILSMPPRVGKSTIVLFFVLWIMLRHPEKSNLYCSYSDTVVAVFYTGLLEILEDPDTYAWKDVFPDRSVASTNAKDRLINIDRMKRYASFTSRSLYGTLNGACDCNGYEIADDLISGIEEAMNKDRLVSAWQKVENNYLPRGKEGTKHLWIGTRWSLTDPSGLRMELLKNDEKFASVRWEVINVPALNEQEESNFDYYCNAGFSTETYLQRRASFERNNDMASWLAQYQGEPIERDGAVFAPEDLRYYNGVLPDGDPDRIFMAVDPAWGGGDFTAAPVCYQYGEDLFVADVVYDNGDKKVTHPLLASTAKKHNCSAMYIEATKMTHDFADGVDAAMKDIGFHLNLQTSTSHFTGTGKEQRIFDKAPDIRERMVFLADGKRSKAYSLFMQNVFSFTMVGKNKHDDAPDSLAMAINAAFFGKNAVMVVQRSRFGF